MFHVQAREMGLRGQNSWVEAGGRRRCESLLCSRAVMGTIRGIEKSLSSAVGPRPRIRSFLLACQGTLPGEPQTGFSAGLAGTQHPGCLAGPGLHSHSPLSPLGVALKLGARVLVGVQRCCQGLCSSGQATHLPWPQTKLRGFYSASVTQLTQSKDLREDCGKEEWQVLPKYF